MDVRSGKDIKLSVQKVHSGKRRIILAAKNLSRSDKVVYIRSDLDSNADTIVAGANGSILQYNGGDFDVSLYHD